MDCGQGQRRHEQVSVCSRAEAQIVSTRAFEATTGVAGNIYALLRPLAACTPKRKDGPNGVCEFEETQVVACVNGMALHSCGSSEFVALWFGEYFPSLSERWQRASVLVSWSNSQPPSCTDSTSQKRWYPSATTAVQPQAVHWTIFYFGDPNAGSNAACDTSHCEA
jgi:hypothetical protein